MEIYNYQKEAALKVANLLTIGKLALVIAPPRLGKTLIAIEAISQYYNRGIARVLVMTKKNAISGWERFTTAYPHLAFTITNYEQAEKLRVDDSDIVIIDESHNFKAFPKRAKRWYSVNKLCWYKPVILLTGTPSAESPLDLYHQLGLSSYFRGWEASAYKFFNIWGISHKIMANGILRETYKKAKPGVMSVFEPYIIRVGYEDARIDYQHTITPITIEANTQQREALQMIKRGHYHNEAFYESVIDKITAIHLLESGIIKDSDHTIPSPKIDWVRDFIAQHRGDKICIMAYFIAEQEALTALFGTEATILSATKYCEGVDLSDYDHYIIYSFGYSGIKFIQLKERVVNIAKKRATTAITLTMPLLSQKIFSVVDKKMAFNKRIMEATIGTLGD